MKTDDKRSEDKEKKNCGLGHSLVLVLSVPKGDNPRPTAHQFCKRLKCQANEPFAPKVSNLNFLVALDFRNWKYSCGAT